MVQKVVGSIPISHPRIKRIPEGDYFYSVCGYGEPTRRKAPSVRSRTPLGTRPLSHPSRSRSKQKLAFCFSILPAPNHRAGESIARGVAPAPEPILPAETRFRPGHIFSRPLRSISPAHQFRVFVPLYVTPPRIRRPLVRKAPWHFSASRAPVMFALGHREPRRM